jgi:hypothetical protein
MLAEVIKAIEVLLAALRGARAPEARRRALAKKLLALHTDLEDVVERGRVILSVLGRAPGEGGVTQLGLLLKQKEALGRLLAHLSDTPVEAASLHVPKLKDLIFLTSVKGRSLHFYISQFVDEGHKASLFSRLVNSALQLTEPLSPERAAAIMEELYRLQVEGLLHNKSYVEVRQILLAITAVQISG